jgi:hypothetical protein
VIDEGRLGKDVAGINDGSKDIYVDNMRGLSNWDISIADE